MNLNGNVSSYHWFNNPSDDELYFNTNLFKDKESAANYKEFMSDVRRLSGKFGVEGNVCYFICDHINDKVFITFSDFEQHKDYYFTKDNARWLLDKYGNSFIKKWILYCK